MYQPHHHVVMLAAKPLQHFSATCWQMHVWQPLSDQQIATALKEASSPEMQDEYVYRDSMTDVVVCDLASRSRFCIKSDDFVQKVAVHKSCVAVLTPAAIVVYSQAAQQECKVVARLPEPPACTHMVMTSQHVICCSASQMQCLSFDGQRCVPIRNPFADV